MVLFDIRTDDSHAGFIAMVNRGLDSEPGKPYLARYGYICSKEWWECFDRGELPVEVLSGEVTFVGVRYEDWSNEEEDVVEFAYDGQIIGYDRIGLWAAYPIHVGDRLSVSRTVAEIATTTGPIQYLIDLRAEWFRAGHKEKSCL